jgi:hypothetical protein
LEKQKGNELSVDPGQNLGEDNQVHTEERVTVGLMLTWKGCVWFER